MNEKKLLKKQLLFLEDAGYKVKSLSKNSENEVCYKKGDFSLEFFFDTYTKSLDVIINTPIRRENIYNSNMFAKEQLNELKSQIKRVETLNDLNQQFVIYSEFIKNNLKI